MTAYYNEIDPYAAAWLRNLIDAGHIADGYVDDRSISDVRPADLAGFTQCHFFAGIGVWSYALRGAGWPDDRPVWTGSCPCQPFSAAGAGEGFADERHLWPHWHHLIRIHRPPNIFGEQVASKDGLGWLDLVQADMEGTDYACWPVDLCAAGVGAPHIRQRLWFTGELAHPAGIYIGAGLRDRGSPRQRGHLAADSSVARILDQADDARLEGHGSGHPATGGRIGAVRPVTATGELGGMADRKSDGGGEERQDTGGLASGNRAEGLPAGYGCRGINRLPGPTNGLWGDADWLLCRDGKWRPVEPGTSPLAHGAASRVGRLRAYGNAIVAEAAEAVIRAYLEHERDAALAGCGVLTDDFEALL